PLLGPERPASPPVQRTGDPAVPTEPATLVQRAASAPQQPAAAVERPGPASALVPPRRRRLGPPIRPDVAQRTPSPESPSDRPEPAPPTRTDSGLPAVGGGPVASSAAGDATSAPLTGGPATGGDDIPLGAAFAPPAGEAAIVPTLGTPAEATVIPTFGAGTGGETPKTSMSGA